MDAITTPPPAFCTTGSIVKRILSLSLPVGEPKTYLLSKKAADLHALTDLAPASWTDTVLCRFQTSTRKPLLLCRQLADALVEPKVCFLVFSIPHDPLNLWL
jgi:hypothetical protein